MGTWLLLIFLGCNLVGTASFLEHCSSSSLLPISLAGVLGSFSIGKAPFPKILEPASTWHFLNDILVLLFITVLSLVSRNPSLWKYFVDRCVLLTLQCEVVQAEIIVCGVFTNESPTWSHFPFNSMSFLFCPWAPQIHAISSQQRECKCSSNHQQ